MSSDGFDDETQEFEYPEVTVLPAATIIAPPTLTRQALHSWPFFIAVIGVFPVILWTAAHLADWRQTLVIPALALTLVAGALFLLRFLRGSQLEAEEALQHEQHLYSLRAAGNPRAVEITASNRVGRVLEADEYALWEFRVHPIYLIWRWVRDIFRTRFGLWTLAVHVTLGFLAVTGSLSSAFGIPKWGVLFLGAMPLLYFWFTIAEWNNDRYALTNKRFIGVLGLTKTRFGAIPRAALLDQTYTIPLTSHLLSWLRITNTPYGRLTFETAGPERGNIPEIVRFLPGAVESIARYAPRRSS